MKKNAFNMTVIFVALFLMTALASIAAAQDTSKADTDVQRNPTFHHRGEMRGMGKFHRGGMGMGAEALTEDQIEKLKAEKSSFQTATRDLRMELQSKRLALRSELVKKEPDVKTAKSLQQEISSLTAELAMKRLEHVLAMKKIAPYSPAGQLGDDMEGVPAGRGRDT